MTVISFSSLTSGSMLKSQSCAKPLFCVIDAGETCESQWKACIRHYPAPWAELAVENLILTVPSDSIRHMENPQPLLTLWNEIMLAISKLAAIPAKFPRPERIVTDVQISCGRYIAMWLSHGLRDKWPLAPMSVPSRLFCKAQAGNICKVLNDCDACIIVNFFIRMETW